jgi:hypothetical protein
MTALATRRALLAVLAAGLVALAPASRAQDPRAIEAQQAARAWLAIADKLDADASYRAAGPKFRSVLTPERWRDAVRLVRTPLGAMERRSVTGTEFATRLKGQPDGEYALVAFRTSWAKKAVGRELVSVERVQGRWQVVGYVIQ